VIDAISDYLAHNNANTGGAYQTSRATDRMIAEARSAMADFLNCDPDEVVFGANMTALTYAMSRAIGRQLGPGNEILLTLLDHDANFSPWKALEEKGVIVHAARFNPADCTLDMHDLARQITSHTRLVAVGYASNAVGTINNVKEIVRLARQARAKARARRMRPRPVRTRLGFVRRSSEWPRRRAAPQRRPECSCRSPPHWTPPVPLPEPARRRRDNQTA
jgi:selenocysteine lyase/cysteine desulfurase